MRFSSLADGPEKTLYLDTFLNRKMESLLEKIQSIYNDEVQVLRKELESKDQIVKKLLETIEKKTMENISRKAVQPKPLTIPRCLPILSY